MADEVKVGIYVRLSRDDERQGESMSIENQKWILADYCDQRNWKIVDTYADDGYTGLNFSRPQVQRLIGDAKSGKINTILVKDLSRFGRNYAECGQYIDDLFPMIGCRFIAVNDGVDTQKGDNDIIPFKNVFNEYYSRDISRKVRSAKMARAKQGSFLGCAPPYGYWFDENDRHKLTVDGETAPIVRRIFQMRADGYGYRHIADVLNEEKIPVPRDRYYQKLGKPNPRNMYHFWTDVTVSHILKNEVYIGNMVQFKTGVVSYKNHKLKAKPEETWVRCEGTHEPIVDMELWDAVRSKRRGKQPKVRRTQGGEVPLFSGLLKCADCGGNMHFHPDKNKRKDGTTPGRHSYSCSTYKSCGKEACSSHWIGEQQLIRLVKSDMERFVRELQIDEESLKKRLIQERSKRLDSEQSNLEKQQKIVENRLAEHKNAADDVEQWVELVKEYMSGRELDRTLLCKLIHVIHVGDYTKIDKVKYQDVEIEYAFSGGAK